MIFNRAERIWKSFCHKNTMVLNDGTKKYFKHLTKIFSTQETIDDISIDYYHRFEIPDAGTKPEELLITLTIMNDTFLNISVKYSGVIKRFISGEKYINQGDTKLPLSTADNFNILVDKFDLNYFKSSDNKAIMSLGRLPKSADSLNDLRQLTLNLVKDIRINSNY